MLLTLTFGSAAALAQPGPVPNFEGRINGANIDGLIVHFDDPTIDFTWDAPVSMNGIATYQLVLNHIGVGWLTTQKVNYPATSHSMATKNLPDGAVIRIHIRAQDNNGAWGPFVDGGEFTVALGPDVTPPTIAANFMGKINGQNIDGMVVTTANPLIDMSWDHSEDASGIERYQVMLNRQFVGWPIIADILYPGQTYAMQTSGLVDGGIYSIHIRTKDNSGLWNAWTSGGTFTVDLSPCDNYWSSPCTWPTGQVPPAGSDVTIPGGLTVIQDVDVSLNRLFIQGTLKAKRDVDLDLSAKSIIVEGSGALLDWGTAADRYTMRGLITLTGNDPNDSLVGMGTKVLGARMGGTIQMHGQVRKSWSRLGANADAGSTTITMAEPVDWEVGDSILIVPSKWRYYEVDQRAIVAINGTSITLDAPLTYDHKGLVQTYTEGARTWTADLRAEVGLLTHNITVQGTPDANGFGGHIMMHSNASAYVDGVELFHMGQKAKLGRYPFHWHMLGDVGQGQYFKNSAVRNSFNRAITIHGTESTLVEGNFCYDHIGHGLFLEDGSERFNVIKGNVVLGTVQPLPGEELTPSDNERWEIQNRTPASYWITNPQNTFEDNVAAGTRGTGFWFALPMHPMGLSATDPRFQDLEPWKLPMISFKRNTAHSCESGFDIFDNLSPSHSIIPNGGWRNFDDHIMEDCNWYANKLGLYTGAGKGEPTENLIFRNNTIVENFLGMMFATRNIVDESAIVADGGLGINNHRRAYRVYDGPGQVHNSYFVGWDAPNASLFRWGGAALKHVNHVFLNNVTDHPGTPQIAMPNFDVPPGVVVSGDPRHTSLWNHVIRDFTGGITGQPLTNIVSNHPFQLVGDETTPSNWTGAKISVHEFGLSRLGFNTSNRALFPNIVCTREKAGTETESVFHLLPEPDRFQLPFIVNEDFEYTYQFEKLPVTKHVNMAMWDVNPGDYYLVRYKDFGKLGGLQIVGSQGRLGVHFSLNNLRNATSSGYFIEPNGDLWIKAIGTSDFQDFTITWTSNVPWAKLDTDGDEMGDSTEIVDGRHPFDASDLAQNFDNNGQFEGWDHFVNVTGGSVINGSLTGTSSGNGDAQVRNTDFDFESGAVQEIGIRIKATSNTVVRIFFSTTTQPGYSSGRKVSRNYTGNGDWEVLTFNMAAHSQWIENITALRLDPVAGVGIDFEIDFIRANYDPNSEKTSLESPANPLADVQIWPNPVHDLLQLSWEEAGSYTQLHITDLNGRTVLQKSVAAEANGTQVDLQAAGLPEGVYLLTLSGNAALHRVKMIKTQPIH